MITSIDCCKLALHSDALCYSINFPQVSRHTHVAQGSNASQHLAANYIDCHRIQRLSKDVSHNVFNSNYTNPRGCELPNCGLSCFRQNSCGCCHKTFIARLWLKVIFALFLISLIYQQPLLQTTSISASKWLLWQSPWNDDDELFTLRFWSTYCPLIGQIELMIVEF